MAHRREQRAAQFVGLLDGFSPARFGTELTLTHQPGRLFGHRRQHPPISGSELRAGHQHPEFVVAGIDRGVGGVDAHARLWAHTRDHPITVGVTAQHADRPLRIRLPDPIQQGFQIRTAEHRPGEQRQQFSLSRRLARLAGALGGTVDQYRYGARHQHQHDDRQRIVRLVDRECIARLGEQIVEQHSRKHRRQQRRSHSAQQSHKQHPDEEQRTFPADTQERVQQTCGDCGGRRGNHDRGHPGHHPPLPRQQAAQHDRTGGLLVGHHVHVDGPGMLHDGRADALIEDARPPGPARRADHQLGGIHLASKIQQRFGHLIADDGVHGRAQAGGELAHPPHLRARHPCQPVASDHMNDHQFSAGFRRDTKRSADQRLGLRPTGDRHHDPLTRLPRVGDLLLGAVLLQRRIDLIG